MFRFILAALLVIPSVLRAQLGGERVYGFINLPSTSRATGTGGSLITVKDKDVGLAFQNPSLLNSEMHNRFSAGTVIYFNGVNFGNFNYVRSYEKIGTFQTGLQYIAYGTFDRTDATGQVMGEFKASEYVLNVGGARDLEKYTFGANVKFILSELESYSSYGAALDLAASYHDTSKLFTATILMKNIGVQFKPYYSGNREPIPFELQAGFSKRFKHLPFRVSVTLHDLQNFNIRYEDPNQQTDDSFLSNDSTSDDGTSVGDVFDEIGRHIILGGELYFGKAVIIGFGYNHQRRQEMIIDTKKGLAGFSFGIMINIKQFSFGFARGRYHIAGASNHFTVGVNFNEWVKKKN
ncbi:MAG: type IX secretion system protein PorQ [Chitinophagales bacterium]|nr:type IX secretion system protein PorQ [Chitinophagales bacterium]